MHAAHPIYLQFVMCSGLGSEYMPWYIEIPFFDQRMGSYKINMLENGSRYQKPQLILPHVISILFLPLPINCFSPKTPSVPPCPTQYCSLPATSSIVLSIFPNVSYDAKSACACVHPFPNHTNPVPKFLKSVLMPIENSHHCLTSPVL